MRSKNEDMKMTEKSSLSENQHCNSFFFYFFRIQEFSHKALLDC
jgi:hypothetical protein